MWPRDLVIWPMINTNYTLLSGNTIHFCVKFGDDWANGATCIASRTDKWKGNRRLQTRQNFPFCCVCHQPMRTCNLHYNVTYWLRSYTDLSLVASVEVSEQPVTSLHGSTRWMQVNLLVDKSLFSWFLEQVVFWFPSDQLWECARTSCKVRWPRYLLRMQKNLCPNASLSYYRSFEGLWDEIA